MNRIRAFGVTASGEPVSAVKLDNGVLSCEVLTFGATLRSLWTKDRQGIRRDIVLGYDTLREYEENDGYLGATVGRYANRIGGSAFVLNGHRYALTANEGENQLHGGGVGFSHRIWDVVRADESEAVFSIQSADGEEGYPGNLTAEVTFSLEENALRLRYRAFSDRDTVCNLTNHSYFNLSGHDSGAVTEQELRLAASAYTPVDDHSIPTGVLLPVEGTPMDLRTAVSIGGRMGADFPQIRRAGGYDHNFAIDGEIGMLRPAAWAWSEESGIAMALSTTQPGVQLYTGNFLNEGRCGKGGCAYGRHHGFCLETQHFPDSPNRPQFPSPVLRAGEIYEHMAVFAFSNLRF